jgi:hypothetical protein
MTFSECKHGVDKLATWCQNYVHVIIYYSTRDELFMRMQTFTPVWVNHGSCHVVRTPKCVCPFFCFQLKNSHIGATEDEEILNRRRMIDDNGTECHISVTEREDLKI